MISSTTPQGPDSLTFLILQTLPRWSGYRYSLFDAPDFPDPTPGAPKSLVGTGTRHINCVTFTYATLAEVYQGVVFDFEWYKRHMLWAGFGPWAGLEEAVVRGIATGLSDGPGGRGADGWYLCQGWDQEFKSGHSFFIWRENGSIRLLESSSRPAEWGAVHWRDEGPAVGGESDVLAGFEVIGLPYDHLKSVRLS